MTSLFKRSNESNASSQSSLSTIYIDERSCLLICKFSDYKEINFNLVFGDLKVKLLFGNLNVNEYDLEENKPIELYADKDNQLYFRIDFDSKFNLTNFKNWLVKQQFNKHVLKEINQLKLSSNQSCYMVLYAERNPDSLHLKYSYIAGKNVESEWIKFEQKDQVLLNDEWKDALVNNLENQLELNDTTDRNVTNSNKLKSKSPKILMFCGGKNAGKSTLIRYLINRQLSASNRKQSRKIYYLDLDPGQSEFTNSGQLSLVEIDKPCLFPTYINVNKFKSQIVQSCSVCSTNVEDLGTLYSENLEYLWFNVKKIMNENDLVFVNTMGFVRIIGFMMLVDAIKLIRPTHLIEIKFDLSKQAAQKILYDINYSTDLNAQNIQSIRGWLDFDLTKLNLNYKYMQLNRDYNLTNKHSKIKRINSQLVYLSSIDNLLQKPLNYLEPFAIKFLDVKIHLALENQPELNLILDILNCSWVQLCKLEDDIEDENSNSKLNRRPVNSFELVKKFGPNECLGNGFIRNIDIKNGLFYILTPESISTIKNVNCLVKPNSINAPKELFIPQLVYSKVEPMYIDVKF